MRRKNGQSTLEYVIVLTAIVAAIAWAAANILPKNIKAAFTSAGTSIENAAAELPQ